MPPSTRKSAVPALILSIAITFIAGCNRAQSFVDAMNAAANRPPAPVIVSTARAGDVPLYLDEIGRTTAREMVAIRAQASGQITAIHFQDGADLHKGDLLFTIDPRPYQAALDQAKATLAQAEASLQLAKDDWARYQSLDARSVSRADYDAKKNAVAVDQALVEAGNAAIETATVNLEYCTIHSPIDGRAGQRLIDLGNVVTANGAPVLLTIQRLDPIYADFTVAENDLAQVRQYLAAGTLKILVRTPEDMQDDKTGLQGDLTFLDNAVQDGTGTVKLRGTLPNPDHKLWPGQFVHVRLILKVIKNAVLVPQAAIELAQTGSYVYVVTADNTADQRDVTLGQQHGQEVVIEKGLIAGDRVVVQGQMLVAPKGKVTVLPPAQPPGATAAAQGAAPSSAS